MGKNNKQAPNICACATETSSDEDKVNQDHVLCEHKLDNIQHCPNVSFNVVTDVFVIPKISQSDPVNAQSVFKGIDTNFNSVTIFGKAIEVFESEKIEGLHALLKKFLGPNDYEKYKNDGTEYIEKSLNQTKLIKIEIMYMTGKRGIKKSDRNT